MPNNTNQESYKTFYTVKEAAKLLGFSTNTIYTYLNKGDLSGRRLNGRGRFKIPFEQLEPFLNTRNVEPAEAPVYTHALPTQNTNKLTGLEVLLGAAAGLLLVYSFWNIDLGSLGRASTSSQTPIFLRETKDAFLSYSDRSFSKYGDIAEGVGINIDKSIFKGSLMANNISKNSKTLGVQDTPSFFESITNSSVEDLKAIVAKKTFLGIFFGIVLFGLLCLLFLLNRKVSKNNKNIDLLTKKPENLIDTVSSDFAKSATVAKNSKPNYLKAATVSVVFFVSVISSVFLALGSIKAFNILNPVVLKDFSLEKVLAVESTNNIDQNLNSEIQNDYYFDSIVIKVAEGKTINVQESASNDSKVVLKINSPIEVYRIDEMDDWMMIETKDATVNGWINTTYLKEVSVNEDLSSSNVVQKDVEVGGGVLGSTAKEVLINETPTGWLRVRNTPSGSEIARVNPGESFKVVETKGKWLLIEYQENKTGWISSEYTTTK